MQPATYYKILAVSLLGLMAGHRFMMVHRTPAVEAYHANIRAAAAALPTRIGPWVGQDTPVPAQATTLLRPNVMISRRYTNIESGVSASFILVHCADAHDMAGHFPLRCYPAQGWTPASEAERDWPAQAAMLMTGSEYCFERHTDRGGAGSKQSVIVANALLRPGNIVYRNMDQLTGSILGAGGQAAGAGQLQIVFDVSVPAAERDAAVSQLVEGHRTVIAAILAPIWEQ